MSVNTTPEISIIVPVYNVKTFLPECLDSVIAQTFKNWELILVDDGSTDGSSSVCDEYAQKDERIRVVHQQNGGISRVCNYALTLAKGKYIGFVDSDDYIEPEMYEVLYNDLVTYDVDIAQCGHRSVFKTFSKINHTCDKTIILNREEALEMLYEDKLLKSYRWNRLFKREVINCNLPEGKCYEDYSTVIKWFGQIDKTSYNPRPLYNYRMRANSIVNDTDINKLIDFVHAEIERYNYMRKECSKEDVRKRLKRKLFYTIVKTSRDVVRGGLDKADKRAYISTMRKILKRYAPYNKGKLNNKTWFRLIKLRYFPAWFEISVRFSHIFTKWHKDRTGDKKNFF